MLEITSDFRNRVAEALLAARHNYDGSDAAFAKKHGLNASIYSRIKNGETDRVLRPEQWLSLGRLLDVSPTERRWNMARTDVFRIIEEEVHFCQKFHKSRIFVDDCAIGKTYSARYLSRTLKNCFYIDKTSFIEEWWESMDSVTLITRPRRFGKTLTMSMTEQFFSLNYAGRADLFEGLSIWQDEKFRALQGTYPVISLTFANIKEKNYTATRKKICQMLAD